MVAHVRERVPVASPKVTPDYRKGVQARPQHAQAEPSSHAVALERAWLSTWMEDLPSEKERLLVKEAALRRRERLPNLAQLKALDFALLAGTGQQLSSFKADGPPLGPLQPGEVRYFLLADACSPGISRDTDPPGRLRSCIKDALGRTRFEVPIQRDSRGLSVRKALHVVTDQGTIGTPALDYLLSVYNMRGTRWTDPAHRMWNSAKLACKRAGLWSTVQEWCVVFNALRGPWAGAAWHVQLRQSATHLLTTVSENNPLFNQFFPELAKECESQPLDWGSSRHRSELWRALRACDFLHSLGDHVRLGRWFSWFAVAEKRSGEKIRLLFFITYLGLQEKYWDSFEQSPAAQGAADVVEEQEALDTEGGRVEAGRGVAQSNLEAENLAARRKECKNTLDLAARILASPMKRRYMEGLQVCYHSLRVHFRSMVTQQKTQRGGMELLWNWALGDKCSELASDTLASVFSSDFARRCELVEEGGGATPGEVKEDQQVAAKFGKLVVNICGLYLVDMMVYSDSVPGIMLLLAHPDAEVVGRALCRLEHIWAWVLGAEERAVACSHTRAMLREMQPLRWQWVRELFVMLHEVRFRDVTDDILDMVNGLLQGILSTGPCEDSFNLLRGVEACSANKTCGRKSRWWSLITSSLATEYDRVTPSITWVARQGAAKAVPASLFCGWQQQGSLSEETLEDFKSGRWDAISVEKWSLIPQALAAAQSVQRTQLPGVWRALLAQAGDVVVHSEASTKALLVLSASRWGWVVWPLKMQRRGDFVFYVPEKAEKKSKHHFRVVWDHQEWKATEPEWAPPAVQASEAQGQSALGHIVLLLRRPLMRRLVAHSATRCFKGLSLTNLRELARDQGVEKACKMGERQVCAAMMDKLLMGHTAQEKEQIMEQRFRDADEEQQEEESKEPNLLMEGDFLQVAEAVLDENDAEELRAQKKAREKKAARAAEAKAAAPKPAAAADAAAGCAGAAAAAGSDAAAPATERARVSVRGYHTPQAAKDLLPRIKGCTIACDNVRFHRWQVSYLQKAAAPYSFSRAWRKDGGPPREAECLAACLRTVWCWHQAHTGEACPWDFEA